MVFCFRTWSRIGLISALAGTLVVVTPQSAAAHPNCQGSTDTGVSMEGVPDEIPWNQSTLGAQRAWPHMGESPSTTTVALVDYGVDSDHPQLEGVTETGANFVINTNVDLDGGGNDPGNIDCHGLGTANAGIIGANESTDTAIKGVAAGHVSIVPVRVDVIRGDDDQEFDFQEEDFRPEHFAEAIRYAADQASGGVMAVSMAYRGDYEEVESAINYALNQDVVIVASAGDDNDEWEAAYPAAYDGVVAVGSIDQAFMRKPGAPSGDWMSLVAPGEALMALHREETYHSDYEGPAAAAAHVAGAAALLRSQHSGWSAEQVEDQLFRTAAGAPGGRFSPTFGYGVVDPYRAVTNQDHPDRDAINLPEMEHPIPHPDDVAREQYLDSSGAIAITVAGSFILGGILLFTAVAAIRRARRRNWTPQRHKTIVRTPSENPATARLFDGLWSKNISTKSNEKKEPAPASNHNDNQPPMMF